MVSGTASPSVHWSRRPLNPLTDIQGRIKVQGLTSCACRLFVSFIATFITDTSTTSFDLVRSSADRYILRNFNTMLRLLVHCSKTSLKLVPIIWTFYSASFFRARIILVFKSLWVPSYHLCSLATDWNSLLGNSDITRNDGRFATIKILLELIWIK